MNTDLSPMELFLNASILVQSVMVILMIASILSWGIIFWKIKVLTKSRNDLKKAQNYYESNIDVLYDDLNKKIQPKTNIEKVFHSGLSVIFNRASGGSISHDYLQKLIINAQERMYLEIESVEKELKSSISNLATIGSVSPYIGLFGTVIGIMHSFKGLSGVKQATIDMVAPGIAEALIATAIGLAAAIPAYIANNKLSEISKSHTDLYYHYADKIMNKLSLTLLKNIESKREK
jgi:biopolymer transport protein TolQ